MIFSKIIEIASTKNGEWGGCKSESAFFAHCESLALEVKHLRFKCYIGNDITSAGARPVPRSYRDVADAIYAGIDGDTNAQKNVEARCKAADHDDKILVKIAWNYQNEPRHVVHLSSGSQRKYATTS